MQPQPQPQPQQASLRGSRTDFSHALHTCQENAFARNTLVGRTEADSLVCTTIAQLDRVSIF